MQELSATSYAILGLLSLQPWTTYELARQVQMSLRNFWPRGERKLYDEPKKLVEQGLAQVTRELVGRRPRSVYRITPKGRRALRQWLGDPAEMPVLEFEALVKVFFAEQGSKEQLLTTLERILESAEHRQSIDARWAAYYLATGGRFPGRAPVVTLVGKLQADLNDTIGAWAHWAHETVSCWPENLKEAQIPVDALRQVAGDVEHDGDLDTPPPGYGDH